MCWHLWKVKETQVLPSLIEQMGNAGFEEFKAKRISVDPDYKPCIVTWYCEKCGEERVQRK